MAKVLRSGEPDGVSLAEAARAGDRAAFGELFGRHARTVHGILLARVGPREAEDLVQEVFLVALERIGTLRDPAAFPAWLAVIARSRAVDHLRGREPAGEVVELGREDPARSEAREALQAILALPEAYRETLVLRLVEGMTGPEIAERTGLTPESVRVNLHRGMKLLKERLSS